MVICTSSPVRTALPLVLCSVDESGPCFIGWTAETFVDHSGRSVIRPARGLGDLPPLSMTAGRWRAPTRECMLPLPSLPGVAMRISGGLPVGLWVPGDLSGPCRCLLEECVAADLGCAVSIDVAGLDGLCTSTGSAMLPVRMSRSAMRWACVLGQSALLAQGDQVIGFGRWASGGTPYVAWTSGRDGPEVAILTPVIG